MVKRRLKSWVQNLLLFCFTFLVMIILLECLLHIIYPTSSEYNLDPNFGILREPNQSYVNQYGVNVKINSKYLRGPEYPYERAPDKKRILVIGDSFTNGVHVQFNETFTQLVEDHFGKDKLDVINAGFSGFSPDKEVIYYLTEGYKYNPDIVVLAFFVGNDLQDARYDSLYSFKDDKLMKNYPIPLPVKEKFRMWLSHNCRTFYLFQKFVALNLNQQVTPVLVKLGILDEAYSGREIDYNLQQYNSVQSLMVGEAWAEIRELLKQLRSNVESHGSELVVLVIPQDHQVDDFLYHNEDVADQFIKAGIEMDRSKPQKILSQICADLRIDCINLLPEFRARTDVKYKYYSLEFERHFSKAGHNLTAEILINYLNQHNIIIENSS